MNDRLYSFLEYIRLKTIVFQENPFEEFSNALYSDIKNIKQSMGANPQDEVDSIIDGLKTVYAIALFESNSWVDEYEMLLKKAKKF